MSGYAIELLHYITYALDNNMSDEEFNSRLEKVANDENITSEDYRNIYNLSIVAYKAKYSLYRRI